MAEELDYYIEKIQQDYEDVIFIRDTIYNKLCEAGNYLIADNPIMAGQPLKDAAYYLWGIIPKLCTYHPPSEPLYYVPYVLEELSKQEVTYKSICEAWGKDDFEGRVATIAFIDRMRQLLWNEPYQVLWAAKPEEQEL